MTPEEWEIWELREREAFAERQAERDAERQKARERDAVAFAEFEAAERAERRRKILACLVIVAAPLLRVAVGFWIGAERAAPPPNPNDFVLITPAAGNKLEGALLGFLAGLLLGPLVAWAIWPRPPRR